MLKRILKILVVLVIVPGCTFGSLYYLDLAGFFNLESVEISFARDLGHSQYLDPLRENLKSQIQSQIGVSLWRLNMNAIAELAAKEKWIESAQISRQWPSTLSVRVNPKDIKLLWYGKASLFYPVLEDGQLLPGVGVSAAPDVTLLRGERFEKNIELRKRAINLVSEIPDSGKFSRKTISEIFYDTREGFWATMMESGLKVKLGEDKFALKSRRVAQVMEYIENRKFEARVIDANLSKKVLVRLRKDP